MQLQSGAPITIIPTPSDGTLIRNYLAQLNQHLLIPCPLREEGGYNSNKCSQCLIIKTTNWANNCYISFRYTVPIITCTLHQPQTILLQIICKSGKFTWTFLRCCRQVWNTHFKVRLRCTLRRSEVSFRSLLKRTITIFTWIHIVAIDDRYRFFFRSLRTKGAIADPTWYMSGFGKKKEEMRIITHRRSFHKNTTKDPRSSL